MSKRKRIHPTYWDMVHDAIQSDLEHGVKWLNERAAEEFHKKYPAISKVLGQIMEDDRE